jgi:hypothetical protein
VVYTNQVTAPSVVKPVDLNAVFTTVAGNIQSVPSGSSGVAYTGMAFGSPAFSMSATNRINFPSIGVWDIDLCAIASNPSTNNYVASTNPQTYIGVSISRFNSGDYSGVTVPITGAISNTLGFSIPVRFRYNVTTANSNVLVSLTNYSGQTQNWYVNGNITKVFST